MKQKIELMFEDLRAMEPHIAEPDKRRRVSAFLDLVMKSLYLKRRITFSKHGDFHIVRTNDAKLVYIKGEKPEVISVLFISRETRRD